MAPLAETPTREAYSLADQSMKKRILSFLAYPNRFKGIEAGSSNYIGLSSLFHLLTTLLEKK